MGFFNNGAGISITGSKIFFAEKKIENKRLVVTNFSVVTSEKPITEDIPEVALISLLDEVLSDKENNFTEVSFTLPLNFYTIFFFPLEEKLSDKEISKQILWEFEQLLPEADSSQYAVSFFVSELNNRKFVNAFAVKKRNIENLQKFALRKNLKIKFIDHPAISAANAFKAYAAANENKEVIFFYFEKDEFAVLLIGDNQIKRIKNISVGFEDLEQFKSILEEEKKNFLELTSETKEKVFALGGEIPSDEIYETLKKIVSPVEINYFSKLSEEDISERESQAYSPILGLFLRVG